MKIQHHAQRIVDWLAGRNEEHHMPATAGLDQSRLWHEQQVLTKRLVHGCALTLLALLAWSAIATVPQ
ncbi:hypothetical protein, partial [Salmonella enterica]